MFLVFAGSLEEARSYASAHELTDVRCQGGALVPLSGLRMTAEDTVVILSSTPSAVIDQIRSEYMKSRDRPSLRFVPLGA